MAPRTKSCAICRQKRIKCDATLPQCLMCIRTGRDCPGIPDGPLIIDMTKKAKHGMQKRTPKVPASKATGKQDLVTPELYYVAIPRISQKSVVTEAFFDRFLTYFTCEGDTRDIQNRYSWLYRLPILSADGSNDALILAVQATAAVYCAAETPDHNPALARYAWDLYGEALRKHSRFVARPRDKYEVTVHMISTSVMFSIFEAVQATDPNAYRAHIFGAAKMLEVTGISQCEHGVLCQIFYHLRTQIAFVYLIGKARGFKVEVGQILHGTLDYTRATLPTFQKLITLVTTMTEMYVGHEDQDIDQPLDLVSWMQLQTSLNDLWIEYEGKAIENGEQISWTDGSTATKQYRDTFTALTVAWFEAARVLLAVIAPQFAASFVDMTDHYAAILAASQYLRIHDIGCAYMRMGTPLLLVALHAPKVQQRAQAVTYFNRWGGGTMRGISALALDFITRQRKQKNVVNEVGPILPSSILPAGLPTNEILGAA